MASRKNRKLRLAAVIGALFGTSPLWAASGDDALVKLVVRDQAQRAGLSAFGEVVEDYGSFVVMRSGASQKAAAEQAGAVPVSTRLYLGVYNFDPLAASPESAIGGHPLARFDSLEDASGDFVVQFSAPIRSQWLDDLRAAGLHLVQYLPDNAYLVAGEARALDAVRGHARVRWVGAYEPEYRLPESLGWVYGGAKQAGYGYGTAATYDIAIRKGGPLEAIAADVGFSGGRVLARQILPNNYFDLLRVELPSDALALLTRSPGIVQIVPWTKPQAEDERASQIVAGNYSSPAATLADLDPPGYNPVAQFGVDGSGVTIAVVDDGVGIPGDGGYYVTAANTVNAPLRGAAAGADGHGHLNASIIAGRAPFWNLDPLGYNLGAGLAPGAHIINIPLLRNGYNGTDADLANDTVTTAGPNGVNGIASNNSWGNGTNSNAYDAYTAAYDGFVRDASTAAGIDPLILVFSAGNSSSSGLTRPKVAKNVISVAASENLRPGYPYSNGSTGEADDMQVVTWFSSRGPAADGRIKPDITAPGEAITGGRSGPDVLYGNLDTYHRISSGTSHAAPLVAGAVALFAESWKNDTGTFPSPALVKAALLNSALEMTGSSTGAPVPNGVEGWGLINLQNVFTPPEFNLFLEQGEDTTFDTVGQTFEWLGAVGDGSRDLRIALVWTDPPGAGSGGSAPALVNDLDLEVTVNGTLYKGNVFSGGLSSTGGTADTRNNVEKILLPGVSTGASLSIVVRASALNGDGVLGNADTTDQNFALVCTNCVAEPSFNLASTPSGAANVCAGEILERAISVGSILDYDSAVSFSSTGLPAPGTVDFSPVSIASLPGNTTATIDTTGVAAGDYQVALIGTSVDMARQVAFNLHVESAAADAPSLVSPAPGSTSASTSPSFSWNAVANAQSYLIEVDDNADFSSPEFSATVTDTSATATGLGANTEYYWRVTANNACGSGTSSVISFTTPAMYCVTPGVAIPDNTPAGLDSSISIPAGVGGLVDDLDVVFKATHSFIGDMIVKLSHNGGPARALMDRPGFPASTFGCSGDNPDIVFDDEGASAVETSCVPTTNPGYPVVGGHYTPNDELSYFDGQDLSGTWTLNVSDSYSGDTGVLLEWCLVPTIAVLDPDQVFSDGFE